VLYGAATRASVGTARLYFIYNSPVSLGKEKLMRSSETAVLVFWGP
jgi:hypothetical protein